MEKAKSEAILNIFYLFFFGSLLTKKAKCKTITTCKTGE